jgi:ribose/xylose/arabinose/galactoside ABC-type transport system permease subunit
MKWSLALPKKIGHSAFLAPSARAWPPRLFMLKFVFFSLASNHFLTPANLITVALQTSISIVQTIRQIRIQNLAPAFSG